MRAETVPLLIERVRGVFCLGAVASVLTIAWEVTSRAGPHPILGFRVAVIGAYLAMAVVLRRLRQASWRVAATASVLGVSLICAVLTVIGILTNDRALTPYLMTVLAMGGAMAFPWGVGPQVVIVVVTSTAVFTSMFTTDALPVNFMAAVFSS